ncbi:MAG: restriction endonuclease subunit S [Syntrophomonadaceae bacterium]|nr:restriction endonuclease subunit S [Syntrophomonadaceae bacterium]
MAVKMKDSGIEWIGEIPEGWKISKVKYFYQSQLGKMLQPSQQSNNESLEKYLCAINITWDGIKNQNEIKEMWFNEREKKIFSVKQGDLLVSEGGDAGRACICDIDFPCYIQNAVHRVRALEKATNEYLYYWMYVLKAIGYIDLLCNKATIMHFTQDKLLNIDFPVAPIAAQGRIAGYLDQKCSDIDKVISAKQRQNELLREQRQSIIYEAVTKGLDKNVKYKDSGIEWIGGMPYTWKCRRLKYHVTINPTTTLIKEFLDDDTEVSFVPMENLQNGYHYISAIPFSKVKNGYTVFVEGDILLAKVTPCFENGNIAIAKDLIKGIGFGSTEILVIRCRSINPRFTYYCLQNPTFKERAVAEMYGVAGLKRIPPLFVENSFYPFPTPPVQKCIADFLDQRCAEIDRILNTNNQIIEKLKEYRRSIIYEAVTGKIEV